MHESEVRRVARGWCQLQEQHGYPGIAGTLTFFHKTSKEKTISMDPANFAAAKRLHAGGMCGKTRYRSLLGQACKWLGIRPPLNPGAFRHTFITVGRQASDLIPGDAGVSLAKLVEVTGQSLAIAKQHYTGSYVPDLVKLRISLFHPDDPPGTQLLYAHFVLLTRGSDDVLPVDAARRAGLDTRR